MRHDRTLRSLVVAGSMALAATTLSATAAVPATALGAAKASPQAAACVDGHDHGAANARVRKGSKQLEPKMFEGAGDQYAKLDDTVTLAAGSVTIPTWFHVVLPAAEATNGSAAENRLTTLVNSQVAVINEAYAGRTGAESSAATPFRFALQGIDFSYDDAGTAWCPATSRSR